MSDSTEQDDSQYHKPGSHLVLALISSVASAVETVSIPTVVIISISYSIIVNKKIGTLLLWYTKYRYLFTGKKNN